MAGVGDRWVTIAGVQDVPLALAAALLPHYRVERELGVGGMATVYLARDVRHDRDVAIKVLKPDLSAIVGAERFIAEIRTTAHLRHPHISCCFPIAQPASTIPGPRGKWAERAGLPGTPE